MDEIYRVPKIYPVDIDEEKPMFSLGVPLEAVSQSVYESVEINHLLNFGYFKPLSDVENGRDFLLFKRNIKADASKREYCEEVIRIMSHSRKILLQIVGNESIEELEQDGDMGLFWRSITCLSPGMLLAIPDNLRNLHLETDHHGAHVRLEIRNEKALLRIKTRSLLHLEQMTEKAFREIAENLDA